MTHVPVLSSLHSTKNVPDVSGNSQIILYPGSVTVYFFNLVPRVAFLPFLSSGENGNSLNVYSVSPETKKIHRVETPSSQVG